MSVCCPAEAGEGPGMNLAERLSCYALSLQYADLAPEVVHVTKQRLVDSIGCALGSFDEEPVRAARRLSESVRVPSSTVMGTRHTTTPDMAAFVNGTMVRYFDFNDGYIGREVGHPSDNIPACMAVAEAENATGEDLILAIVLAYEIQCRFQDAANLYRRGWDHVNYVLISSSIAAGRLLRLSHEQMTQAINIALSGHLAMRQVRAGELSAWKGSSAANAARNGVFAALLARHGMTGPSPIFEGEMGFFKQVTGEFELDPGCFGSVHNGDFMILRTLTKMLPTNGEMQTAVWAALDLRARIADPADIVSVTIETTEAGYRFLGKDPEKWRPRSRETADHSLPYTVARALIDGEISVDSYSEEKISEPRIVEWMRNISVAEDQALTALFPKRIPNRVTVRLASGEVMSKQVDTARGSLEDPMTDEDFESKFDSLVKAYYTEDRRKKVLEELWNLENQTRLSDLFETMVVER
jgi:2-methylcitrate dehydratase